MVVSHEAGMMVGELLWYSRGSGKSNGCMADILLHTKPVFVLGFNSTIALLSQGHETPAPPGVSSCICEELLGSA